MRKPFVCGNWKLHLHLRETQELLQEILSGLGSASMLDVVVAPVATLLFAACDKTKNTPLRIAAQNVFYKDHGAFTGEWSVQHLLELGCSHVIVGHSERRQYFNESSELVAEKTKACFAKGITPIVCVGETQSEREQGKMQSVLVAQLTPVLQVLHADRVEELVLAYEPVWAIGTGKNASAQEAEEAHLFLRQLLQQQFGDERAEKVRIIYGGSVKPENAQELLSQKNVDGALVGGASLKADSFLAIVEAAKSAKK